MVEFGLYHISLNLLSLYFSYVGMTMSYCLVTLSILMLLFIYYVSPIENHLTFDTFSIEIFPSTE